MSGTQTSNFDAVLEFSQTFFDNLLATIFDTDGYLCQWLTDNNLGAFCGAFDMNVVLGRPTDLPANTVPAGVTNVFDITILLGAGFIASLRAVVGVDIDRRTDTVDGVTTETDVLRINYRDRLYYTRSTFFGFEDVNGAFMTYLRNEVQFLPMVPIQVNRGTSDPKLIRQVDAKVLDDTSATNRDALALMLTMGGGNPGNAGGIGQTFIPVDGSATMAIGFAYICRILTQFLESDEGLGLPAGRFVNCELTRNTDIEIDGDTYELQKLEVELVDDFIQMKMKVYRSGFCWEATSEVTSRIRIAIENGALVTLPEVDDPDVDVDVPWYCYLAAAILGALTGGLASIAWAIVGAVAGPIIMYIFQEVMEGLLDNSLDDLADSINALGETSVPVVDVALGPVNAFIDDVQIQLSAEPKDRVPVHSEGSVILRSGQFIDLDSGRIGGEELAGADLSWAGTYFFGSLRTVCDSALARTWSTRFDTLTRSKMYPLYYESPASVPVGELGSFVIGFGDFFKENLRVYAVRTNEERYSAVRVTRVDKSFIQLQYRTYEKFVPTVEIAGGFHCESPFHVTVFEVGYEAAIARYKPAPLGSLIDDDVRQAARYAGANLSADLKFSDMVMQVNKSVLAPDLLDKAFFEAIPLRDRRVGHWTATIFSKFDIARFDAITMGLQSPMIADWEVDGQAIVAPSGEIVIQGVSFTYTVDGKHLVLRPKTGKAMEFELKVTITDDTGLVISTARCVRYVPECTKVKRHIPDWGTYWQSHMQDFGIVEVVPEVPPPVIL